MTTVSFLVLRTSGDFFISGLSFLGLLGIMFLFFSKVLKQIQDFSMCFLEEVVGKNKRPCQFVTN